MGKKQQEEMDHVANAIEKASTENKPIVAMGDFNIDENRINDKTYRHKRISDKINKMKDSNDVTMPNLLETFFKDTYVQKFSRSHLLLRYSRR